MLDNLANPPPGVFEALEKLSEAEFAKLMDAIGVLVAFLESIGE